MRPSSTLCNFGVAHVAVTVAVAVAFFMICVFSHSPTASATENVFPIRKYPNNTVAIVANHTQVVAKKTTFRGDVFLQKINHGQGAYVAEEIEKAHEKARQVNETLISMRAMFALNKPGNCHWNNTKSAVFNFTTNTYESCKCLSGWTGENCTDAPPLTDVDFNSAISECLTSHPIDGLCSSSEYGLMPNWNVSQVTTMKYAFQYKTNFNGDISRWNVSSVSSMYQMF